MRQVLFRIPFLDLPIYGYGVMLCLALFASGWYAARSASKQGKNGETFWDLLFWVVFPGIVTARVFYFIQYREHFSTWISFFYLWEGGLVVYGSVLGGLGGLIFFASKNNLRVLWLLDLVAPIIGLGLAFGRIGCLLNGCCYGDYCEQPWQLKFPFASPPYQRLVTTGLQSPLGFMVDAKDHRVVVVEPQSSAAAKGIHGGDEIITLNGRSVDSFIEGIDNYAKQNVVDSNIALFKLNPWPLEVAAQRGDSQYTVYLDSPRSLPIHPTQVYSSINGLVVFFLLAAYYPFRRRDGEVIALFALVYSVNRFLIEFLRFDELPLFDGLTISQNLSLVMFTIGLITMVYVKLAARPTPTTAA